MTEIAPSAPIELDEDGNPIEPTFGNPPTDTSFPLDRDRPMPRGGGNQRQEPRDPNPNSPAEQPPRGEPEPPQTDVKEITKELTARYGGEASEWRVSETKIDAVGIIDAQDELLFKNEKGEYQKTSENYSPAEYKNLMQDLNSPEGLHFTELVNTKEGKFQVVVMQKIGQQVTITTFWKNLKPELEDPAKLQAELEYQTWMLDDYDDDDLLPNTAKQTTSIFSAMFGGKKTEAAAKETANAEKVKSN